MKKNTSVTLSSRVIKDLLPIRISPKGYPIVSARELHRYLEVEISFSQWFTQRVAEYRLIRRVDYHASYLDIDGQRDYIISLDNAKILSLVEYNKRGEEAWFYFSEAKTKLQRQHGTLETEDKAMQKAHHLFSPEEQARRQQEEEQATMDFIYNVMPSDCCCLEYVSEILDLPGIEEDGQFEQRLIEDKILIEYGHPYQQYQDAGYFKYVYKVYKRESVHGKPKDRFIVFMTFVVTSKGLAWLIKRYKPKVRRKELVLLFVCTQVME